MQSLVPHDPQKISQDMTFGNAMQTKQAAGPARGPASCYAPRLAQAPDVQSRWMFVRPKSRPGG